MIVKLILLLTFILPVFSYGKAHWGQAILSDVETLYNPLVKSLNQTLEIGLVDMQTIEAASAESNGKKLVVHASPGLLLNPQLTPDGFRIILCHELGHIFGGAPRRSLPYDWDGPIAPDGLTYMTSEGQADFYATAACFRQLVVGQNHQAILAKSTVNRSLRQQCDSVWGSKTSGSAICQRAGLAAENFLKLSRDFDISFEKPDQEVTEKLLRDEYPSRQCRLDTFLRGALCKNRSELKFNFDNQNLNECSNSEGKRPSCWYIP